MTHPDPEFLEFSTGNLRRLMEKSLNVARMFVETAPDDSYLLASLTIACRQMPEGKSPSNIGVLVSVLQDYPADEKYQHIIMKVMGHKAHEMRLLPLGACLTYQTPIPVFDDEGDFGIAVSDEEPGIHCDGMTLFPEKVIIQQYATIEQGFPARYLGQLTEAPHADEHKLLEAFFDGFTNGAGKGVVIDERKPNYQWNPSLN